MDKKGHHELGFAPYAIIIASAGVAGAIVKKFWHKMFKNVKDDD